MNFHRSIYLVLLASSIGCGAAGGGRFGDMALPKDCDSRCPTGWSCNDGVCVGDAAKPIALGMALFPVSGAITVDGAPPLPTSSCSGDQVSVSLTNGEVSTSFFEEQLSTLVSAPIACADGGGTIVTKLPTGTYRIVARGEAGDTSFPSSTVIVEPALHVSGPVTGAQWKVTTVPVSGVLTVDGAPPVPATNCNGDQVRLALVNDQGASFETSIPCNVSSGAFTLKVVPGSYRVLATNVGLTSFPSGTFVVQPKLDIAAAVTNATWALTTVPVSGTIALDGVAPTPTTNCFGDQVNLTFSNDDGALVQTTVPCQVSTGAFSVKLAPGKYRVLATGAGSTETSFPSDTIVMQRSLDVSAALSNAAWNVTTVTVSGTVAIDGVAPTPTSTCSPTSTSAQVRVTLADADGARYSTSIPCSVSTGAFTTKVAQGTYQLVAEGEGSTSFPSSAVLMQKDLNVVAAVTGSAWNVVTKPVTGTLLIDGVPPTPTSGCSSTSNQVSLSFVGAAGDEYSASIPCVVSTGAFMLKLPPGTYRVLAHGLGSTTFPSGTYEVVNALQVQ